MDVLQRHRNPQPERFRQRLSFEKYRAQHAQQRHAPFPELLRGTIHEKDRHNNTKLQQSPMV